MKIHFHLLSCICLNFQAHFICVSSCLYISVACGQVLINEREDCGRNKVWSFLRAAFLCQAHLARSFFLWVPVLRKLCRQTPS